MKAILVFCTLSLNLLLGVTGQAPMSKPEADARSVAVIKPLDQTSDSQGTSESFKTKRAKHPFVKLAPIGTIPLDFLPRGVYLSDTKFDDKGNIYFSTLIPSGPAQLFKLDRAQRTQEKIVIPGLGNGEIRSFHVDDDGTIYVALTWPNLMGAIAVLNSDFEVVSEIHTGSFLPMEITVDSKNRIWAAGQLFKSSEMGSALIDVQVRIYRKNGGLINVATGGLATNDPGLSAFIIDDSGVKLTSFAHAIVYDFASTRLVSAHTYPFHISTDTEQLKLTRIESEPKRRVKGVTRVNDSMVWYGNIGTNRGGFGHGFIGITGLTGEPLTSEIELPAEYQAIAGVDSRGYLYVYSNDDGGQLALRTMLIEITGAR